ncbi:solute carrier family 66 member 3-like isoform X2 [Colossoma macropomum]|uniref:solute carrier family 66 member 3-like isoform X2 n=1 Tax=Colossoma macropomum TaxID=42526 RepID=UPI0018641635|nr:solute carrier family 66 member 3-like isoform X2 [Colossoma macropomum]
MARQWLLDSLNFSTLLACTVLKLPQIALLTRTKSPKDTVLFLLILHYSGNLRQSLIFSLIFVGGSQLLTLKSWIIDSAMSLCTFISASSRFAQLQCLWQTKDAGQVSALTWAMSTYTCMARILTTVLTSGDLKVLLRFVVMTTLNGWVLATVVFYKQNGQKLK